MRPAHKFKGPTATDFADDKEMHSELATEWWHVLDCGRRVAAINHVLVFQLPTPPPHAFIQIPGTLHPGPHSHQPLGRPHRRLLDYNAQCVSDLNKREQQHNFDTFADDIIFPEMQHMLAGDAPYDYSGSDGKLRIYWSEFSRMIQTYFDTLLGGDGSKASFAMIFSYIYICFHTRDFGLSTIGMIHILMSVPISLAIYIGPLGFDRFNTLCPLGVFVILGIGADDIFIMVRTSSSGLSRS